MEKLSRNETEEEKYMLFRYFHNCLSFHPSKKNQQSVKRHTRTGVFKRTVPKLRTGVADPDPYVFGPPGLFYHQAKLIVRKTLIPTVS